jgi:hypothetical protein
MAKINVLSLAMKIPLGGAPSFFVERRYDFPLICRKSNSYIVFQLNSPHGQQLSAQRFTVWKRRNHLI